jgi:threonine/homoserine/homoserine lactone efflux protein
MEFVLEGILFGLTLAVMMGPIFIAITQASIEMGTRPGLSVCLGVWISDFLIILGTYLFIRELGSLIESEVFKFYLGISGGLILIVFGIGSFFKQISLNVERKKLSIKSFTGFLTKGFLVNTINPFTFVFWIGVMSTYVLGRNTSTSQTILFLSSIMITIMLTDVLKVMGAKLIRKKLTQKHISIFSKTAGAALFIFGLFLIYRVY